MNGCVVTQRSDLPALDSVECPECRAAIGVPCKRLAPCFHVEREALVIATERHQRRTKADPKCPKCSYPYLPDGPYLGIYDPTRPCDNCRWNAPTGKYTPSVLSGVRQLLGDLLDAWRERRRG